jgi:hypothetical protein
MRAQSIPAYDGNQFPASTTPRSRYAWPFALACCLYYFLAYGFLVKAIPIFAGMFAGLEVALPLPTRVLMASYSWLLPVWSVSALILTIAKQLVALDKVRLRAANVSLVVLAGAFVPLVVLVLYLPLLELIWKLFSRK